MSKPYPIFERTPGGGYARPKCSQCGEPWAMKRTAPRHVCASKKVKTRAACQGRGRTGFTAETVARPPRKRYPTGPCPRCGIERRLYDKHACPDQDQRGVCICGHYDLVHAKGAGPCEPKHCHCTTFIQWKPMEAP